MDDRIQATTGREISNPGDGDAGGNADLPVSGAGKVYRGVRSPTSGFCEVLVRTAQEEQPLRHPCGLGDACVTPSGWAWGFGGLAGEALSRWLLADAVGAERMDDRVAYRALCRGIVERLPPEGWELVQAELDAWIAQYVAGEPPCGVCGTGAGRPGCVCAWRIDWR